MTESPIDVVTDEVLDRLFDGGSVARGRKYASEHRVRLIGDQPGLLKAVVAGSGRNTYLVRVEWQVRASGVGIYDDCSCPLGGACKHTVATILTARAAHHEAIAEFSDWRRALTGIVDTEPTVAARLPLALQVTLDVPASHRSRADVGASATIRPLRMGKRDRWIKSGADWRDFTGYGYRVHPELDPAHTAVIRTMAAGGRHVHSSSATGPALLADFGPEVWLNLERAREVGVALVDGDGRTGRVQLADEPASLTVDLGADADGNVTLSTFVTLHEGRVEWDRRRCALIGRPAHGAAVTAADGSLTLVRFDEAPHPDLTRLLDRPPLRVPAAEVDEFLDVYQPHLAQWASVGSSDGSVDIASSTFESLVLAIGRTAVDEAGYRWLARYRRGERVVDHDLGAARAGGRARSGRDLAAERAAIAALDLDAAPDGALRDADGRLLSGSVTGVDAVHLLSRVVPKLTEHGQVAVEVEATEDAALPQLREAEGDPLVSLQVADAAPGADGTDWFDLTVEVSVDGEEIPFVELFRALSADEEVLILPSGTWLTLDRPEFSRLKALIDEARGLADTTGDDTVRINRFQAGWWDELTELGVVHSQSEAFSASLAAMRDLAAPESVEPPEGLQAKLRPYQQQGLDWLAFLHRNAIGGILADDMGLGKTIQALATCLVVRAQQPEARFLVVAPTSVVANWAHEAMRFAPGLSTVTITATDRRRGTNLAEATAGADLVVTSYALFRLEFEAYAAIGWEIVFLDEAQFVKNHQGKTYQCVRRIGAVTKVAMTGTPMENSLMDLWSLLSIVAPGLYPDPQRFSEVYRKPIERGEAPELLGVLRRRVAPLMRRRTKEAVLADLPPKIEQTIEVELGARHARIYQTQLQRQRQRVLGLVGDLRRNRFEIFKSLTLLRQLSLDPGLVDPDHDGIGSAKLDRLVEDLTQVLAEGHRALVFSQFTRYLARVRDRLDAAGIDHAYLDGRTRNRARAIAEFTEGTAPVFVISLKAGGVGLNLTQADYCFVLDPWWNPAVETQAVDRAHRIGQSNPVVVYRYVSTGTIEEKVMALKARKAALFSEVIDADGAMSGALTESDIRGLFDPG